MHTLAHIGFYIAVTLAIIAAVGGAALAAYSALLLAAATDGVAVTPRGNFPVPKKDIGICWEMPLVLVCVSLFWVLVASGLVRL